MVVSHYVGAGIEPRSSGSVTSTLMYRTISLTPGAISYNSIEPLNNIVLMPVLNQNDQSWHIGNHI